MGFVASENIKREAMDDCVKLSDYVLRTFGVRLDWTDESIEKVEELLEHFHQQAQNDKPTEAEVFAFAKGFGSYIGEVYRRNHGAEWGNVTMSGSTFPGLRAGSGVEFWPWGRTQQRIIEGPSNNVWHYYQALLAQSTVKDPQPPSAPTWWRRLFGRG